MILRIDTTAEKKRKKRQLTFFTYVRAGWSRESSVAQRHGCVVLTSRQTRSSFPRHYHHRTCLVVGGVDGSRLLLVLTSNPQLTSGSDDCSASALNTRGTRNQRLRPDGAPPRCYPHCKATPSSARRLQWEAQQTHGPLLFMFLKHGAGCPPFGAPLPTFPSHPVHAHLPPSLQDLFCPHVPSPVRLLLAFVSSST